MNIIITGAAVGIGAQIARELAVNNDILLHYNQSEGEMQELRDELMRSARSVRVFRADLTTRDGCLLLTEFCKSSVEALDVLVNNAGGMVARERVGELRWETLQRSLELNVISTMFVTSELLPLLLRSPKPSVVNITSIAIRHGSPTATAYGAAKAAIDSFTRGAARELGPKIRVNAVAPGVIETRFHERVSTKEQMLKWKEDSVLKRVGDPRDVSAAVAFLIRNEFMTGETIDVNGGLFMR